MCMKNQNNVPPSPLFFASIPATIRFAMANRIAFLMLALLVFPVVPCFAQTLMDRYSFTTDASDSVGTNNGTLFGDAVVQNNALVLDGEAYVSLPPGTITTNFTALTIEIFCNLQTISDDDATVIAYFGTNDQSSFCRLVTKA